MDSRDETATFFGAVLSFLVKKRVNPIWERNMWKLWCWESQWRDRLSKTTGIDPTAGRGAYKNCDQLNGRLQSDAVQ